MGDEKPKKKIGLIPIILMVLGVLFIVIMLIPDDGDETTADQSNTQIAQENTEDPSSDERPRDEADVTIEDSENSGSANSNSATSHSSNSNSGKKSVTIMVYVNGSDLESEYGEATQDISEMLDSGIGKKVNVIIQTMGTKKWQDYDISSKTAQTYKIQKGKLKLIRDNLGQLDCTAKKTLSEFIGYCKENYPAERYIFQFWDHGGGPVYGFGYDEWQSEDASLTIAEIAEAFAENDDIHFDLIGMDCCIMASMETLYAFAPYCKYALLSEDFESGLGWSYTGWMKKLEKDPGMSTPLLGKYIIDDIIKDNEKEEYGDSACMGLFNVSTAKNLYTSWKAFAYKNEAQLLKKNYSKVHKAKGRGFFDEWLYDESDVTMEDYYISDILALVESIDSDSDEAKDLKAALRAAVAYYGHTSDKNELTGLAVSLPYGDSTFYKKLSTVYKKIGLDSEYIDWLEGFVSSSGYSDYYDYDYFENSWGGWGSCDGDYGCSTSGSCDTDSYYDDSWYDDDGWYDDDSYYYDDYYDDDWIYDYDDDMWYYFDDCYSWW